MKKLTLHSPFQRFLAALTGTLVIWGGVIFGDIYLLRNIQHEAVRLMEAKTGMRGLEMKRNSLAGESDWIRGHAADIAVLDSAFVDTVRPLGFIETIEDAAKMRGVALKLSLPQKRGSVFSVGFNAEASREALLSFFAAIEGLPHQTVVREFTFEILGSADPKTGGVPARLVTTLEVLAQ